MCEFIDVPIWKAETGILDLPENWESLARKEMRRIETEWTARLAEATSTNATDEFMAQLNREWSIETGIIENLYDISEGVTAVLVEHGFQMSFMKEGEVSPDPETVAELLEDQREALEGLFSFVKQDQPLSKSYIDQLHATMTKHQDVTLGVNPSGQLVDVPLLKGQYKRTPNYPIRDGKRFLYCPPEQTESEMDRLITMHSEHRAKGVPCEVEAAWLHHRFTQIHPYMDGNGRVARALATLVLVRDHAFPLVVSRREKAGYLNTLELADEGDLRPLVLLISRLQYQQFQRAHHLLAKHAPDSKGPEEAARRLASVLANTPEAREARIRQRALTFANQLQSQLTGGLAHEISQALRQSSPVARFSIDGVSESTVDFNAKSVAPLAKSQYLDVTEPVFFFHISLKLGAGPGWSAAVATYPVLDDLNEAVRAGCLLNVDNEQIVIDPFPLETSASFEPNAMSQLSSDWVNQTVTKCMDIIRRRS